MDDKQLKFFHTFADDQKKGFTNKRLLKIHLDTAILLGIINVLIIVVAFSFGLERGRRIAYDLKSDSSFSLKKDSILADNSDDKEKTAVVLSKNSKIVSKTAKNEPKQANVVVKPAKVENKEKKAKINPIKPYIVQLACYLHESRANKEKKLLAEQGLSTDTKKSDEYIVLYVGGFKTRDDAEKIKAALRDRYRDCFVKKL